MYIRTKDGAIYDLKNKEISSIEQKDCWVNIFYYDREKGQYLEWDDNGGRSMDTIYKTEILNQSETLEELCDGFYIDEGDKFGFTEAFLDTKFNKIKAFYLSTFDFTSTLYGFIKTNNGLVYVAKLNKKGKLELL